MKRALLLSASSYKDSGYLNHCKGWIKEFLGSLWEDEILFIPFAGVRHTLHGNDASPIFQRGNDNGESFALQLSCLLNAEN